VLIVEGLLAGVDMPVALSLVRSQLVLMPAVSHSVESMLAAALAVGLVLPALIVVAFP
jgi:hypothetical protein